jgi:hypothetical protein
MIFSVDDAVAGRAERNKRGFIGIQSISTRGKLTIFLGSTNQRILQRRFPFFQLQLEENRLMNILTQLLFGSVQEIYFKITFLFSANIF